MLLGVLWCFFGAFFVLGFLGDFLLMVLFLFLLTETDGPPKVTDMDLLFLFT